MSAAPVTYPKRPSHYAHKFCRLLAKGTVANEIGADACWLLTVIAHTEDAKGYRGPVLFKNGQLMTFCGLGSEKTLERVRSKAVAAGWLHYIPGRRGVAPRYWVLIPPEHLGKDDLPSDERPDKYEVANSEESESQAPAIVCQSGGETGTNATATIAQPAHTESQTPKNDVETGANASSMCRQLGGETGTNATALSSLHLHLHQHPPDPPEDEVGVCDVFPEQPKTVGPNVRRVVDHWNAHPGLMPAVPSDLHRDRMIRTWATTNAMWVEHWGAAIAFMGRTAFYCGGGGQKWRADLTWLFEKSNFSKVVERMLDDTKAPVKLPFKGVIHRAKDIPLLCPKEGQPDALPG